MPKMLIFFSLYFIIKFNTAKVVFFLMSKIEI